MPEIIDATSHIITEDVLDSIGELHDTEQAETLRSAPRLSAVDGRVDYLDRHGIDRQVINLARPTIWLGLDPEDALEATRLANDQIQEIADEYPDRFVPMGTLPFLTGEYLDELDRCVNELDQPAIQIFSNVNGEMLDAERFEPFWEKVDELDVPVWIHPQIYDWHDFDEGRTWIYKALGWPFETSIAIARLVFSGVLERNRNVEIVSHHLGGTLPYLVGRFKSWYQTRQEEPELYAEQNVADLSEPLDFYLERVYGDTATSSQGEIYPLQCGYEFFGADNMVYSSDYPMGPDKGEYWPEQIIDGIGEMNIPDSHKRQIYSENVKRLLDL